MKTNVIDNSDFPVRKVLKVRAAKKPLGDVTRYMTLVCGHVVGLRRSAELPTEVGCYWCHREGK